MKEPTTFRMNGETKEKVRKLMKDFPDDYKTTSQVIRAGIIALERWKYLEAKGWKP